MELTSAPVFTTPVYTAPVATTRRPLRSRSCRRPPWSRTRGTRRPRPRSAGDHRAAGARRRGLRAGQLAAGREAAQRLVHGLRRRRAPESQQPGWARRRAMAARALFLRHLTATLDDLQRDLPAGEPRLNATDFKVGTRANARVPAGWTGTGALAGVSRPSWGGRRRSASPGTGRGRDADAERPERRLAGPRRARPPRAAPRPAATVDRDTREELFALVVRAEAAGAATNPDALAAFHLARLGVTAAGRPRHFTVQGHRVPGLNWGEYEVTELDTGDSDVLEPDTSGGYDILDTNRTPWFKGPTPYVVAAEGGTTWWSCGCPTARSASWASTSSWSWSRRTWRARAADGHPDRAGRPVRRGPVPRPAAQARGPHRPDGVGAQRRGQAHRGPERAEHHRHRPARPHARGDWIASVPGMAPDPGENVPDWYERVVTRAIVSALTGKQIGRAVHHAAEYAEKFEDHSSHLDQMATFVHYNVATKTLSKEYDLPARGRRTPRTAWTCTACPVTSSSRCATAAPGWPTSARPGRGSSGARACRRCPRTTGSTS
ncbi:hypothetical protein NKH77_28910 [Streptomyces sp. M19]